jgi:hypothetical protein
MKQWFSAQELAGVTGLPDSARGVRKKADSEQWVVRSKAEGKGNEYHIESLPAATQRALRISEAQKANHRRKKNLITQDLAAAKADEAQQYEHRIQGLNRYKKLNANQKRTVDCKLELLSEAQQFHKDSGLPKGKAYTEFSALYMAEEITVDPWVRQNQPKCSRPTLYRWEKEVRENGIDALAGDCGKGKRGTGLIDTQPALQEYILGMLVEFPHIKISTLHKACRAEFADKNITLPSARRLGDWVNKWKDTNRALFSAVTNPDEWKNKYMDAQGSASEHVTELNQVWEFDSTPADLMLTDGRHSILGVIDVWSRRTKFIVMPTSNSKGVARVIRWSLLSWGVAQVAKTDNGADYKSKWIKHVFKALGIDQQFCPPFQGWKKPHIERVFRTFAHDLAELLPGFIGHNVAERKSIEARKSFSDRLFKKDEVIAVEMSAAELQSFCDRWLEHEYHPRKHSSLGMSPNAKVASWQGPVNVINDERLLDVLLSEPAGTRTIVKSGIKLDGGLYIHPELAAHTGEQVNVFYDEMDMGRIYVYNLDGEYLCTAEDPDITGVSREEVAIQAKAIMKESIQEERRRLKAAARKVTKRDVAQQVLDHRAEEERAEKVRHFPRPESEYTSEGLEAARAALEAQNNEAPQAAPAHLIRPRAQVIRPSFTHPEVKPPEDYEDRYLFACEVGERVAKGEASPAEEDWFKRFKCSTAYEVGKDLHEMRKAL